MDCAVHLLRISQGISPLSVLKSSADGDEICFNFSFKIPHFNLGKRQESVVPGSCAELRYLRAFIMAAIRGLACSAVNE